MVDFHTHILPEVDDGSTDALMSVALLKELKNQGVKKVLLTPHFYAYASSAEIFAESRETSKQELLLELKKNPVDIELYLGCEVLYFEELWRIERLKDFSIMGTEYILVEMPFAPWSENMVRGVEKLIGKGLTPVIAHFERYIKYSGNWEKLYEMVEMGALLQMNCKYIKDFRTRRRAIKLIKSGAVFAIGTDCHNLEDRAPDYREAVDILKRKLSDSEFKQLMSRPNSILKDAERIY